MGPQKMSRLWMYFNEMVMEQGSLSFQSWGYGCFLTDVCVLKYLQCGGGMRLEVTPKTL